MKPELIEYYKNVALKALLAYDLEVSEVSFMCEETNVFFKVKTVSDELYALKIFQEASSKISDNLAEVFFIDVVKDKTDLNVPTVIKTKHDKEIVLVEDEEGKEKRIALYEWLDGVEIDENETLETFYDIGKITATLHLGTKGVTYPTNITPKRWDKVFYYIGEEAEYMNDEYQKYVDERYIKVMDKIIPYLDKSLSALYDGQETQLIHGDLNPFNIMKNDEEYQIIDFEEAFDALPVHDLAIHFFYYEFDDRFEFEEVIREFMKGYHEIIPVTDFQFPEIEMLMTARRVNFLNYCLTVMEDPSKYIEKNIPRVEAFMEKYDI
jgi:Ser/Thr protein kinase RdoA (MazF antagonist)